VLIEQPRPTYAAVIVVLNRGKLGRAAVSRPGVSHPGSLLSWHVTAISNPGHPGSGPSRFRLAVKSRSAPPRPYAWEIYDDEGDEEPIRLSLQRFRTPKEAWEAGSIALEAIRVRSFSVPSLMQKTPDGVPAVAMPDEADFTGDGCRTC